MTGSVDQLLDYAKSIFTTLPTVPSLTSVADTTFKIITGVQVRVIKLDRLLDVLC